MKFKVDENLPSEITADLRARGHDAESVVEEGLTGLADDMLVERSLVESRVLLTLDKGMANLRRYPKAVHGGLVLFRPGSSGRGAVLEFVRSRLPEILELDLSNHLTVVTETRLRRR